MNKTKEEFLKRYAAGERDFTGVNLRKTCLTDISLIGINLSSANLEDSLLMRNFLTNANLSSANLKDVNLSDSYLMNASLSKANLRDADLHSTDLTGADLTYADLTGADLTYAKLIGANLSEAKLNNIKTNKWTIFHHTIMPSGSQQMDRERGLSGEEFKRRYADGQREFAGIVLHRVNLEGANLPNLNLSYSHFSYVNLRNAILEPFNLRSARIIYCDLRGANLKNGDFTNTRFIRSDLREAQLSGEATCTSFIEVSFQGGVFLCGGQSPPFCYNVILPDGEYLAGYSECYKPINFDKQQNLHDF
ncbi:pentapeptide repeat-containing protein [Phormidium nigroviride]